MPVGRAGSSISMGITGHQVFAVHENGLPSAARGMVSSSFLPAVMSSARGAETVTTAASCRAVEVVLPLM